MRPIVMISSWPQRLCGIATFAEKAVEFIRKAATAFLAAAWLFAVAWPADCAENPAQELRKKIIAGVAAGQRPKVLVPIMGRKTRGTICTADGNGIRVELPGKAKPMSVAWQEIDPKAFYSIARKFADTASLSDHRLLLEYCRSTGLDQEAAREKEVVVSLGGVEEKAAVPVRPKPLDRRKKRKRPAPVWAHETVRAVLTERTARWEHEANLEGDKETFGAEHNPTGNPIGGGEGYQDILTKGDYTVRTYDDLRDALEKAKEGQVVFIPGDVEIGMTGRKTLSIPAGVTLASTRGHEGSQGALIFSDTQGIRGLFGTGGDCVRITGLRIRGPHPHRTPAPDSYGILTSHFGLEVDNCDVSGFSFAGINVRSGASRAYVHHNFIHHNQRHGLGYGVALDRSDALIEANIFDWCRHHICGGSGAPGAGYEARYNICRANANGHLFDMHGEANGSGIAGDWMNMHHNTFMCRDQTSIGIRGTPSQGANIHHNWFDNPDPAKAVFVIAWAFGPGKKNWAMRSIGDQSLGNSHAYRNVYGSERKLIDRTRLIQARLGFTRGNLRSAWAGLSNEDLIEIIRVQQEQLKALGASVGARQAFDAKIKRMSKDGLIDMILAQLVQIHTLDTRARQKEKK